MTNKEAIEMLKNKMDGSVDTSYSWCETIRLAIQALKKTDYLNCEMPLSEEKNMEEEAKEYADDMDKLRIENAELIQRILKLEEQLSKEFAYNDALVKAIRFHYPNS